MNGVVFIKNKKLLFIRLILHLFLLVLFTLLLNELALGLVVSVFSRCYVNKIAKKINRYTQKLVNKQFT